MTIYYLLLGLFLFFIALLIFFYLSQLIALVFFKVPTVGTPRRNIVLLKKLLPQSQTKTFYDLGSGTGKVIFALCDEFPQIMFVGFDASLFAWLFSWLKKTFLRKKNVEFKLKNFFKESWQEADLIYTYLWPSLMGRVEQKFLQETKSNSELFDSAFKLPNLKPSQVFGDNRPHLYLYKKD